MECQRLNSKPYGEEGCRDVFVLGKQIASLVLQSAPSHLGGSNLGLRPLPSLSYHWEAFPWLSLGLGFSFRFLVSMKFCHVFWLCSPLRFLWGNGNATKLLVAIPMFHSWKLGSHLLHELLGIGLFCSSAQA